jgi:hypothetical protein
MKNVVVSIPIGEINYKKECHWPPNIYLLCDTSEPSWLKICETRNSQNAEQLTDPGKNKRWAEAFYATCHQSLQEPRPADSPRMDLSEPEENLLHI